MPRMVELHVAVSGSLISVNPDCVCRIGTVIDLQGKSRGWTFVHQVDGNSVNVEEPYAQVKAMLEGLPTGSA